MASPSIFDDIACCPCPGGDERPGVGRHELPGRQHPTLITCRAGPNVGGCLGGGHRLAYSIKGVYGLHETARAGVHN